MSPPKAHSLRVFLFLVVSLVVQSAQDPLLEQSGWFEAPTGRFGGVVSISGRSHGHVCFGVLVDEWHVLTAGHCSDVVGPMPLVSVGVLSNMSGTHGDGAQHIRVETTFYHKDWNKDLRNGYDASVLRLSRPVSTQVPLLAEPQFDLYPNSKIHTFRLRSNLEVSQADVVDNRLCPCLPGMASNTLCAYSESVAMVPGCSGAPVLVLDGNVNKDGAYSIHKGSHRNDVVVGIVSYANYSSLEQSGTACVDVGSIRKWIRGVVKEKDGRQSLPGSISMDDSTTVKALLLILILTSAAVLVIVYEILEEIRSLDRLEDRGRRSEASYQDSGVPVDARPQNHRSLLRARGCGETDAPQK